MNTRLWRMVRIMVTMLSLTMLVGLAGPAEAQDTDPKDDCKQGGWETLTTADGEAFDNQGNCVSYVAAYGGVPVSAPVLNVTVSYNPFLPSQPCSLSVGGSNFPAGEYQLVFFFDEDNPFSLPYTAGSDVGYSFGGDLGTSLQVEAYASDGNGNPVGDPVAVSNLATC